MMVLDVPKRVSDMSQNEHVCSAEEDVEDEIYCYAVIGNKNEFSWTIIQRGTINVMLCLQN